MSILPRPADRATSRSPEDDEALWAGHPTIDDSPEALEAEAAYRAEQDRRFAADPTDDDLARWAEEYGDGHEDDALYDALADDAAALGRLELALCL